MGEDTGLPIAIPPALSSQLFRELSAKNSVADVASLAPLGEAALRADDLELAYAVSAAGLHRAQEKRAEFLFLRARALPDWFEERQSLCAAAASELARRQRNHDLLRRIGEWREEEGISLGGDRTEVAMTTGEIENLIQREIQERQFPGMPDDMDGFEDECDCPACRAEREGIPQGFPPGLDRLMEEMGPDVVMQALDQLIGGPLGKPKKRRSRRAFNEDDMPF